MAITLFKALSATGLKVVGLLQALVFFPAGVFHHVLSVFSQSGRTHPPALPCSVTDSSATSSDSAQDNEQRQNNDSNSDVDVFESSNSDMTGTSSSSRGTISHQQPLKKAPIPKIIPALPRIPPVTRRENSAATSKPTPANGDSQLANGLARLSLKEASLQRATGPLSETSGNAVTPAASSIEKKPFKDPFIDPNTTNGSTDISGNLTTQEVIRSPLVPMTHLVSQTSKLKEASTVVFGNETVQILDKEETPEQAAERATHSGFMRDALDMARLALKTNETPVGCVLVYQGRVIARGMNATNVSRNGTRHAELMAICALLSYTSTDDTEPASRPKAPMPLGDKTNQSQVEQPTTETSTWGDVDPSDGHLYPFGQKLHPAPHVDPSVIHECTLYVTVEPCVMCASLLRQFGIKKVFFGAVNDKFGGTGGVFRIHKNSPYSMASVPPSPAPQNGKGFARPVLERRPVSTSDVSAECQQQTGEEPARSENGLIDPIDTTRLPGDGGNVERGYEVEGGWGRDEAVTLLRQFYVQENNRAPVPRKKEGRAARLAAMMERDGHAGGPMIASSSVPPGDCNGSDRPEVHTPTAGSFGNKSDSENDAGDKGTDDLGGLTLA